MDPNETLTDLLCAFERGDLESASDYLESLLNWINRGGFLPKVERWEDGSYTIGD